MALGRPLPPDEGDAVDVALVDDELFERPTAPPPPDYPRGAQVEDDASTRTVGLVCRDRFARANHARALLGAGYEVQVLERAEDVDEATPTSLVLDAAVDEAEAILRALLARDVAFRCILLGEGRRSDELADLVRPRRLLRLSRSVGSQELLSRLA